MAAARRNSDTIVIMAGGAGERFWPLSNRRTPKQLLRLQGGRTMLDLAFRRASKLVAAEGVYIVAGRHLREAILAALPDFNPERYIAEPEARNTAACLGLAAATIAAERGPDVVMGVLTADHVIDDGPVFGATVRAAMKHAGATGELVTIGMEPTEPHTGYGYIELAEKIADTAEKHYGEGVFRVKRFHEKPDAAAARDYLRKGTFLWNSGMFFWRASALLDEFDAHLPEMGRAFRSLTARGAPPWNPGSLTRIFRKLPSIPVDTAILEKSDRVAVVRGRFAWDDVGSWDAVGRLNPSDKASNCLVGPVTAVDSGNNIVYNDVSDEEAGPEIVLHGVHDFVIVRTDAAILITPKSRLQDVKQVVRRLRDDGRDDLL